MNARAEALAAFEPAKLLLRRICLALPRYAYRFSDELQLHEAIAQALTREGIPFNREHCLGEDRLDFFCEGVGIEVKVDGSAAKALTQVDRYCKHEEVRAVVLVSTKPWAGLCSEQVGKWVDVSPGHRVREVDPEPAGLFLRDKPVRFIRVRGRSF